MARCAACTLAAIIYKHLNLRNKGYSGAPEYLIKHEI